MLIKWKAILLAFWDNFRRRNQLAHALVIGLVVKAIWPN